MPSGGPTLNLLPGLTASRDLVVDESVLVGKDRIFPLSRLVAQVEQTALWSVQSKLPEQLTTVGYEVKVELSEVIGTDSVLAITTRLSEVDGRHLLFEVVVTSGDREVARGFHRRTVVPMLAS